MSMIDPSVPRYRFWSDDAGGTDACPKCGHALINEQQTYVMVIRQAGKIKPFIVGAKAGFFCPECPTVVLDRDVLEDFARRGIRNSSPGDFTVLGLLDVAAIPPDKFSRPLGEEGNPIPLVKFRSDGNKPDKSGKGGNTTPKKLREKGRKRK